MLENIEHLLARYPFVPFQEMIHSGARSEMCKKNAHGTRVPLNTQAPPFPNWSRPSGIGREINFVKDLREFDALLSRPDIGI
jgi:hypothetical protein